METNQFMIKDGRILTGFPKRNGVTEDDSHRKDREHNITEKAIFIENAHFLMDNAEKILSDSRFLLAPVGIISGGAFMGTFPKPVLGGYIERWKERGDLENLIVA